MNLFEPDRMPRDGRLRPAGGDAGAFTLIEILTAVVIFGIVLAAINTVFYGAMRLRTRTSEAVDSARRLDRALNLMERDLRNIVPPRGVLSGSFQIGPVSTGQNTPQWPGIAFYTSTGVIDDTAPWGDIQKVVYQLRDPVDRSLAQGKDLVRCVTRNLLSTTTDEALVQRLMSNVQTLEFYGFTGAEWRPTWDTTISDTNLPTAIQVRIQLAGEPGTDNRSRQPIQLFVPLDALGSTNQVTGGSQ